MATVQSDSNVKQQETADKVKPTLYVPCNELKFSDIGDWLAKGWQDYKASWRLSMAYGAFFAISCMIVAALVMSYGSAILLFSLSVFFILLAPIFCFGLYDVSKELKHGRVPSFTHSVQQMWIHAGTQWVYSIMLLVIGMFWLWSASILHIFYPTSANPTFSELSPFLLIGSVIGAGFLALVFGSSAFSLPMIMDRHTETFMAVITSLRTASENPSVSIAWAFTIFALIALGFATGFLGLIIVLPLIGYSSFHAYRTAIQGASDEYET